MKEFSVSVRVKNNRLLERREQLGLSQSELAELMGVACGAYNGLESMRDSPFAKSGQLRNSARKVLEFYDSSIDELWPEAVLLVKDPHVIKKLDAQDMLHLSCGQGTLELESPDTVFERHELKANITKALSTLNPRYRHIIETRYGLDGSGGSKLRDVATEEGISSSRAQQIERTILRRLRRTKHIKPHLDDE